MGDTRKNMTFKQLLDLHAQGKRLMVKFTKDIEDVECFFGAPEMLATIMSFVVVNDLYKITFDFSANREHNLALQSHNWYVYKAGCDRRTGTALEAGHIKPDLIDHCYFDADMDMPFVLPDLEDKDSPLSRYLVWSAANPGHKATYVEWLEGELVRKA